MISCKINLCLHEHKAFRRKRKHFCITRRVYYFDASKKFFFPPRTFLILSFFPEKCILIILGRIRNSCFVYIDKIFSGNKVSVAFKYARRGLLGL